MALTLLSLRPFTPPSKARRAPCAKLGQGGKSFDAAAFYDPIRYPSLHPARRGHGDVPITRIGSPVRWRSNCAGAPEVRGLAPVILVRNIFAHTPSYVWALLALLLVMGFRRLRQRRTHLALAAIAPLGSLVWSLVTAASLFAHLHPLAILSCWGIAFAAGAGSARIRTVPRPVHDGGWVFVYSATWQPLAFYMLLFVLRYGLGIWEGLVPAMSDTLGLVGISLSALTAGRTTADFIPPMMTAIASTRAGQVH